jgi:hypothetical protein
VREIQDGEVEERRLMWPSGFWLGWGGENENMEPMKLVNLPHIDLVGV